MAEHRGWPYEPVDPRDRVPPPPSAPFPVSEPAATPDFGPPAVGQPTVSRTAVIVALIAAVLAVTLATAGVSDWWLRNRELDALLDAVERSERAQYPYLAVADQTEDACLRQVVCNVFPVVEAAEVALVELERSAKEVADTKVARFHGNIRTFRDVYLEHNRAWQDHLGRVVVRPAAFVQPGDDITATWAEVMEVAKRAVPPLPQNDAPGRIDRILNPNG